MCGLVGAFKPAGDCSSDKLITAMRDRMAHRGPDGGGIWRSKDGTCAFGHRRLSIIDLSTAAAQPMLNERRHGGGHLQRRNLQPRRGPRASSRRSANTAGRPTTPTPKCCCTPTRSGASTASTSSTACSRVAIYDGREPGRPVVHLIRDRVGIKPVYFTRTGTGRVAVRVGDPRASRASGRSRPRWIRTAFWHYLTFIVAPAPLTMFRGIFKLPAGHIRHDRSHADGRVARQLLGLQADPPRRRSPSGTSARRRPSRELTRLLKQSIARRMVSDVPFGVLLSGGVDSSMNVALMSELMDRPVTTFTIGYEGKEDYNEFQLRPAHRQRYKTDHHETLINSEEMQDFLPLLVELQDEPIADNVCIPLYFLARLVKDSGHDRRAGRRRRRRELPRLLVVRALPPEGLDGLRPGPQGRPLVVAPRARSNAAAALHGEDARNPARAPSGAGAVLGRRGLLVGRACATS